MAGSKKNRIVELQNVVRALKTSPSKTETKTFKKIKVLLEEAFPNSKWDWVAGCSNTDGAKARTGTCGVVGFYDKTILPSGSKSFKNLA